MGIKFANITGIHFTVAVDVSAGKLIPCKQGRTFCVSICFADIAGIDLAVAVDVSFQVYLRILRHRLRSYRDLIFPRDMIFLRHLHGVVAGRNAGNGVGSGISLDGGVVCRRRGAALEQLHRHRGGGGIKALHRAGERPAGAGINQLIGVIYVPDMPVCKVHIIHS